MPCGNRTTWVGFHTKDFYGTVPNTSSVRGNERGNNLLFQRGERVGVKVDRKTERQEKDQAVKVRNGNEGNQQD